MKRRAFITSLFATAAIAIFADPTQAKRRGSIKRGRRVKGARARANRGTRVSAGKQPRVKRTSAGRSRYQPTSYTAPRNTGTSVTPRRLRQAPVASRPAGTPAPDPYAQTRGNNGTLTEKNVDAFRSQFDQRQSRQAMRAALGEPAEHTLTKDRWRIQQTDIYGRPAEDGWFEADYGLTGWHLDSKTVRPPNAKW